MKTIKDYTPAELKDGTPCDSCKGTSGRYLRSMPTLNPCAFCGRTYRHYENDKAADTLYEPKTKGKSYKELKAHHRDIAIKWQHNFGEACHYWSEIADAAAYFAVVGRRFGLLREFRENGIIGGAK